MVTMTMCRREFVLRLSQPGKFSSKWSMKILADLFLVLLATKRLSERKKNEQKRITNFMFAEIFNNSQLNRTFTLL